MFQKNNNKNNKTIKRFFTQNKSNVIKSVVFILAITLFLTSSSGAGFQYQTDMKPQQNPERDITWDVTVNFNEPSGETDYVVFGEAPDAHDGPPVDAYDTAKPPAPIPSYIRAYLKDGLPSPHDKLWMDYRHYPATAKVWNLSVQWYPEDEESPTTMTISWSPTEVATSEYTSVNLCTNLGVPLKNMLVNSSYTFTCPALVIQNFKIICTVSGNSPPLFGTPSPANGSTNQPLSLSWGIPINDPEGNAFSWTIQCSNGQMNSGTGATNGTKSLSLSGLAYSTTYTVWVNATDPTGSGQYTRRWYRFTTKANLPPVFGTPTPGNGSTNQPLSLSWSILISDPEGNPITWTIQCSNGQGSSGSGASNGTRSLSLSGLAYSTTYTVWVNATDPAGSGQYTRRWYRFTTLAQNLPPVFGTPSPVNGSTGQPLSLSWSILISDPEGNTFTWSIQCSNGQSNGGSGASNGTKSVSLSGLAYSTTYTVWVNATDPAGSGVYTRKWYTFTTQVQQNLPPNKPNTPSGPVSGKINSAYNYTTSTIDTNGDQVFYLWDWGDGSQSDWLGPYNSGVTINTTHTWITAGNYEIKVKAKDIHDAESNWSDPLAITITTESIVEIKGGLGVKVMITNEGTTDVTDVEWQIHVQGGIFKLINKTKSGIVNIPAGTSVTVKTGLILGLGRITITAEVADTVKTAQGFVLFFAVLGVKENTNVNDSFER